MQFLPSSSSAVKLEQSRCHSLQTKFFNFNVFWKTDSDIIIFFKSYFVRFYVSIPLELFQEYADRAPIKLSREDSINELFLFIVLDNVAPPPPVTTPASKYYRWLSK